jgi:hypothetical protein
MIEPDRWDSVLGSVRGTIVRGGSERIFPIGYSTCWVLMLIQRSGRRSERGIRPSYP